jgi:hypothetical protein
MTELPNPFQLGRRKNVQDTLGLKSRNIRQYISFVIFVSFFTT